MFFLNNNKQENQENNTNMCKLIQKLRFSFFICICEKKLYANEKKTIREELKIFSMIINEMFKILNYVESNFFN